MYMPLKSPSFRRQAGKPGQEGTHYQLPASGAPSLPQAIPAGSVLVPSVTGANLAKKSQGLRVSPEVLEPKQTCVQI